MPDSRTRAAWLISPLPAVRATMPATADHSPAGGLRGSAPERPRHHQRELFSPERVAVRPGPFGHDNVGTGVAQRDRPAGRVLEEERLERAGDEVLSLPLSPAHSDEDIQFAIHALRRVHGRFTR